MSRLLQDKVAVVTGGTRGLGRAIAEAFAGEGASVVVASRSADSVERAVAELSEAGHSASGLACDVGDQAQVAALAEYARATFGGFDVWVNNAGVSGVFGPTLRVPSERFEQVLRTNTLGVYYGSAVAMRYFTARGHGKLINMLGRGDRKPAPFQSAYGSSKSWVRSFTLALAEEYRESGVGVYAFNPGLVLTELLTDVDVVPGYEGRMRALETIIRMWANPPEVPARKAVWLASAATNGRTGLQVSMLTPPRIIGGALREGARRLMRRQVESPTVRTTAVEV